MPQVWWAEFEKRIVDVVRFSQLAYVKVADVRLGNLIVCGGHSGPEFALRVAINDGSQHSRAAAILLRSKTHSGRLGAVVYDNMGEQACLDLGPPIFGIESQRVLDAIPTNQHDRGPGSLGLQGHELLVLAMYGPYGMSYGWWQISTGLQVSGEECLIFQKWCLGIADDQGRVIPQMKFPEDYLHSTDS